MADKYEMKKIVKARSAPTGHNQSVPDPIAHFKAIPWCAALLEDQASGCDLIVPDRTPLDSGESNFVRKTMNSSTTLKSSITFFRPLRAAQDKTVTGNNADNTKPLSKSKELLSGGGPDNGENPRNPFLLFTALADLGVDCQSYAGTLHGGLYGCLMDEAMGTAANFQSANGAYTVRITTNMRRPVRMPQVVVIRGRVIRREGRKLHVRGTMEDKKGEIMAEADGLWLCMAENVGRSQL